MESRLSEVERVGPVGSMERGLRAELGLGGRLAPSGPAALPRGGEKESRLSEVYGQGPGFSSRPSLSSGAAEGRRGRVSMCEI